MKVSVVMPMRDVAPYVGDAVRSILGQSFADFEFLIVDDESTDDSVAIVEACNDSRIRLLRSPERLGFSGALNRAIDEATGEYIARMDADDISRPHRLQAQVGFMDAQPDVGLCGGWARTFGLGQRTVYRPPVATEDIRAAALFDCPFVHPTVMIRRSLLREHGLRYDASYSPAEDYALWDAIIARATTANLGTVLLDYRVRKGSMSVDDWSEMDAQAARINRRALEALGIAATETELALHRNIGRGRGFAAASREEFVAAERWLQRLLDANVDAAIYGAEALRAQVASAWYRLCFHNLSLGPWVWTTYRQGPLAKAIGADARRSLVLALANLRRRIFGRSASVTPISSGS